jgi:phosphate transport system substrate-binding protein
MSYANEKRRAHVRSRLSQLAAMTVAGLALVLAAGCGDDNKSGSGKLSGSIKIDGSSTVGPLTEAAAELFREENPDVKITVGISGTGGGFEKFCAKEIDVSDASRPIDDKEEVPVCKKNSVSYDQIQVANDGITVVVNPDNDWAKCLTTDELKKIWDKGSKVDNWSQVRSGFPDEKLKLFGPGTDSGTFDFFTEEINGEKGQSRSDYSPSEDDNVTVQGVAGGKGNAGYFGLSYAEENTDKVKIVQVDGGDGCVTPSTETVQDGSYKPLSRPLFIYPSVAALKRPEVDAFVKFYVDNYDQIAQQAKLVPMTTEQADKAKATADKVAGGSS